MGKVEKIHILGICGTFMGSLAQIAQQLGYQVSGSDAGVYPPMSDQLMQAGISLTEGFDPQGIPHDVDLVIIGNALSRGNPAVEYVLESGLAYASGPQWLGQQVLRHRHVFAVAGTHGKTTTASMLAWILEEADKQPSYLIGGVPENFGVSARLTDSPYFVIEADEYDTAFFDKRSKFVHYYPRTLVFNNLEFDHADIFPDLAAIERQFHHAVRLVPGSGRVLLPEDEPALQRVLQQGCWSQVTTVGQQAADWHWQLLKNDCTEFLVRSADGIEQKVSWHLTGLHNVKNAVIAMAAAADAGVTPAQAASALASFVSVKRRMELVGKAGGVEIYDDFAHHPTAIATTLEGVRARYPNDRIVAVLEPRSNTMKLGTHKAQLAESVAAADLTFWFQPEGISWSVQEVAEQCQPPGLSYSNHAELLAAVSQQVRAGDRVVVMSNGSFAGFPRKLLAALQA